DVPLVWFTSARWRSQASRSFSPQSKLETWSSGVSGPGGRSESTNRDVISPSAVYSRVGGEGEDWARETCRARQQSGGTHPRLIESTFCPAILLQLHAMPHPA